MRQDVSPKRFIEVTYNIISEEGEDAVSIRRLGREMNCNTANIYRYFSDLDELVTYASLRYLSGYLSEVAEKSRLTKNSLEMHLMVWDCFSRHAFQQPRLFSNIFFGRHSRELGEIIRRYYEMFPEDLATVDASMAEVFTNGSFDTRDYLMISHCVDDGWFSREDARYLNTLTIHMFIGYLDDLLRTDYTEEMRERIRLSFMDCLERSVAFCRLK